MIPQIIQTSYDLLENDTKVIVANYSSEVDGTEGVITKCEWRDYKPNFIYTVETDRGIYLLFRDELEIV